MGRHSSKPFSSLWNSTWNERTEMDIIDEDYLDELSFDPKTKRLEFVVRHYHREPKITRYVTSNYVRTPVYEDYSERTRLVKKFNKIINPIRFINEEILNLKLAKKLMLEIIAEIGIIPEWRKKELELDNLRNEIRSYEKMFRNFNYEKNSYSFKETNYQDYPSNFWLRFFLGFFSFFLSFIGFISKNQALVNQKENEKNEIWNKKHKKEIDVKNEVLSKEIKDHNSKLERKIKILSNKVEQVKNREIKLITIDDEGWIDLRKASNFSYSDLLNKKGVYIIWNKTKNKYYIGQSKNMGRRMLQHFKDGDVKNIIFAKDWYDGDLFCYKYYFCATKDELDSLEKRYIEEYNSFENGYNSTAGNI